jgi:hypothetical protein
MEKRVRIENEDRIHAMQEKMKQDFSNAQRLAEQHHYEAMMQRERDMQLKLEDERRRLETDFAMRERAIEDRTREMMRLNNEQHHQEDEYRRREQEELVRRRMQEEKQTIESEFNDQRTRLERQIAQERQHERQLLETTRRERQLAEERAMNEVTRVRHLEQELSDARITITELRNKKEELTAKMTDYEKLRGDVDRMAGTDNENR